MIEEILTMKKFILLFGLLTSVFAMAENQPIEKTEAEITPIEFNLSGISFDKTYKSDELTQLINRVLQDKNYVSFQANKITDTKTDQNQIYQIKLTLSQDWERNILSEIKGTSSNPEICFYQTSLIRDIIENKYNSKAHIIHNSKTKQNSFVGNINDDIEYKIYCSKEQNENKDLDNPYFANIVYYNLKHTPLKKKSDEEKTKEIINKSSNMF